MVFIVCYIFSCTATIGEFKGVVKYTESGTYIYHIDGAQ